MATGKHDQIITIENEECSIVYMDGERPEEVAELQRLLMDTGTMLAVDTETTGTRVGNDRIRLFQIGTARKAWVFPFDPWREQVQNWLWNRQCRLLTQNGLFDYLQLSVEYGSLVPLHALEDTYVLSHHYDGRAVEDGGLGRSLAAMIAHWLDPELAEGVKHSIARFAQAENEQRQSQYTADVEQLKASWRAAVEQAKREGTKRPLWKDVQRPERPPRVTIGTVYREIALTNPTYIRYAGVDILALERIYTKMRERLEGTGVHDLSLYTQDIEDMRNAVRMGFRGGHGVGVDTRYFEELGNRLSATAAEHMGNLRRYGVQKAGSTREVAEALQREGFVLTDRTDGGALQVNERVLVRCEQQGSVVAKELRAAKRAAKWKTTFVDGILDSTRGDRIFPQLNPLGAATGRFSSSNPNMQNIPSSDNSIRHGFRLDWSIDYSGQELRAAALMSKDSHLTGQLQRGENPMKALAARVFGTGYSPSEYVATKVIVYATLYSGGPAEVSRQSGEPYELVKTVQDTWFETYHEYKAWTEHETQKASRLGYVIGWDGRVMVVPRGKNYHGRIVPKPYTAPNRIIQGFGAALMKAAIRTIWTETPYGPYLALTVHDELDGVCPKASEIGKLFDAVIPCMETTIDGIAFPVEAEHFVDARWKGHYGDDTTVTTRTTPGGLVYAEVGR